MHHNWSGLLIFTQGNGQTQHFKAKISLWRSISHLPGEEVLVSMQLVKSWYVRKYTNLVHKIETGNENPFEWQ